MKTIEDLALSIMMGTIKTKQDIINLGWCFRKNKGVVEINKALVKARNPKNTFGKLEYELDMFALYLKGILKVNKTFWTTNIRG